VRSGRRGFVMAVVLVAAVLLTLLAEVLLLRQAAGHRAASHGALAYQKRYESLSLLSELLARLQQGDTPEEATAAVDPTGQAILYAGDRFLVDDGPEGTLVARLSSRAYGHVLFGTSLDLRGAQGGFCAEDPRAPAQGTPPGPQAGFLDAWRRKALQEGILLLPEPEECRFRPGGGEWMAASQDGRPSFLYLGGGAGEGLGWTPGLHRWTLEKGAWTCTTGESLQWSQGTWEVRKGGRLAGPLLIQGSALRVSQDARVDGTVVVWGGALELGRGTLAVHPDQTSSLAIAVLRGEATAVESQPWNQDRALRPGDLVLATGSAGLEVGYPHHPEATGGLVLAQNRLVRIGGGFRLAGVATADRVEIHGVPAQDLVWSGRVSRIPPEGLGGGDLCLERERSLP